MPSLRIVATLFALVLLCPAAQAQDDGLNVDLALVLSADASGSIDEKEFALQREGIAGAISDPEVFAAIKSGRYGRIAVTLVEWGTPGAQVQVVRWHIIGSTERAEDFAMDVRRAPRGRRATTRSATGWRSAWR